MNGFFVILWKKEKLKNGESEIRRHKICMFYFDHKGKIFFLIGVSSTKLFIRKLRVKNIPYKNFYAWRSHIYLKVLYPIKLKKKSHYSVQCICTHIYIAYLQKIQISKVPKLWTLIPTFLLKKMIKKFENKTYLKNDNKSQNKIYVVFGKNAVYQSLYVAACFLFFWSFLKQHTLSYKR